MVFTKTILVNVILINGGQYTNKTELICDLKRHKNHCVKTTK